MGVSCSVNIVWRLISKFSITNEAIHAWFNYFARRYEFAYWWLCMHYPSCSPS